MGTRWQSVEATCGYILLLKDMGAGEIPYFVTLASKEQQ